MGMRETEGSLRAYLLLAGVIGVVHSLADLSTARVLTDYGIPAGSVAVLVALLVASVAVAVGYVVAGIRLKAVLPLGALWVQRVLLAGFILSLVQGVFVATVVAYEAPIGAVIGALVAMAVTSYLLVNVRRLVAAARERAGAPVAVANR